MDTDQATHNRDRAQLYLKMANVMAAIEEVHKDGKHPQGWTYASASAVANEIRKHMAAQKLAFIPRIARMSATKDGRWVIRYEFTFADGETGMTESCLWYGEAMQNAPRSGGGSYPDDKSIAKASTTAVKYFLLKTFMVSTDDDPDNDQDDHSESQTKSRKAQPKQQQPPPPPKQEPPPPPVVLHQWATADTLADIFNRVKTKLGVPDMTPNEFLRLADVQKMDDHAAWNAKYGTGKAAYEAAIAAFGKPAETKPEPEKAPNLDNIIGTVTATKVKYVQSGRTRMMLFQTHPVISAYGRSDAFKKEVGIDYYNANGFEKFEVNGEYEIKPLKIGYKEVKDGKGQPYFLGVTFNPDVEF